MAVEVAILMVFCHVIADFVLQPIALSQMKCKAWWINECSKNGIAFDEYKSDYIVALIMHGISWSVMILLPIMFLMNIEDWLLLKLFLINAGIHAFVDDQKTNRHKINLWTDQFIHIWQMLITYYIVVFNPNLL